MVRTRSRLIIAVVLALFLVAMTASAASARRVSPWVGRWQTMDIPGDGSTNTLTIMYAGPGETYRLIWQETYFSLCEGAPGIGRGRGLDTPQGWK